MLHRFLLKGTDILSIQFCFEIYVSWLKRDARYYIYNLDIEEVKTQFAHFLIFLSYVLYSREFIEGTTQRFV